MDFEVFVFEKILPSCGENVNCTELLYKIHFQFPAWTVHNLQNLEQNQQEHNFASDDEYH